MGLFSITDFDRGINSQDNPETTGKFTDCVNFDIDKRGKLVKREAADQVQTGFYESSVVQIIKNAIKWVHASLAGGAEWLTFIKDNTTDKIVRYPTNWAATKTDVESLSGVAGTEKTRFIPFTDVVRCANGVTRKPGIFQYIDRQFFFGNIALSQAFNYDDATPSYPATWTHLTVTVAAAGANPTGHYYYKFVPVFDGYSEPPLPDNYSYYELTSNNQTLNVPMGFSTSNWNKRITAIKLYRSFSPTAAGDITPVYYHIQTIPVNTSNNHTDLETYTSAHGSTLTDPDATFDDSWVNKWLICAGAATEFKVNAVSEEDNTLTVTTNGPISNTIWGGAWSIYPDDGTGTGANTAGGSTYDATNGYAGRDVIVDVEWVWDENERNDWVAVIGSEARQIINSKGKAIQASADYTGSSSSVAVALTDKYYITTAGSTIYLNILDNGLLDGAYHPLAGISKVNTNYKFGVKSGGRFFAANVALDPDGDNEVHKDWLIYSELNQPDILPIKNYIQLDDLQGGEITGIEEMLGNIVVFMEKGIFSLGIPSDNPAAWSLRESDKHHGCIAPDSIIKVGSTIFYAGRENLFVLNSSVQSEPIANDIKDTYQAVSNLENTELHYDPKKERLLCKFGNDTDTIYIFDVGRFFKTNETVWTKYTFTGVYGADHFAQDENMNIFTINETDGTNSTSSVSQLYGGTPSETGITASYKTGILPLGDMLRDYTLLWASTAYTTDDPLSIKIYTDRSPAADDFTETGMGVTSVLTVPTNVDVNGVLLTTNGGVNADGWTFKRYYTNRIGRWANFAQVELISGVSATNTTINKMELETL